MILHLRKYLWYESNNKQKHVMVHIRPKEKPSFSVGINWLNSIMNIIYTSPSYYYLTNFKSSANIKSTMELLS